MKRYGGGDLEFLWNKIEYGREKYMIPQGQQQDAEAQDTCALFEGANFILTLKIGSSMHEWLRGSASREEDWGNSLLKISSLSSFFSRPLSH